MLNLAKIEALLQNTKFVLFFDEYYFFTPEPIPIMYKRPYILDNNGKIDPFLNEIDFYQFRLLSTNLKCSDDNVRKTWTSNNNKIFIFRVYNDKILQFCDISRKMINKFHNVELQDESTFQLTFTSLSNEGIFQQREMLMETCHIDNPPLPTYHLSLTYKLDDDKDIKVDVRKITLYLRERDCIQRTINERDPLRVLEGIEYLVIRHKHCTYDDRLHYRLPFFTKDGYFYANNKTLNY